MRLIYGDPSPARSHHGDDPLMAVLHGLAERDHRVAFACAAPPLLNGIVGPENFELLKLGKGPHAWQRRIFQRLAKSCAVNGLVIGQPDLQPRDVVVVNRDPMTPKDLESLKLACLPGAAASIVAATQALADFVVRTCNVDPERITRLPLHAAGPDWTPELESLGQGFRRMYNIADDELVVSLSPSLDQSQVIPDQELALPAIVRAFASMVSSSPLPGSLRMIVSHDMAERIFALVTDPLCRERILTLPQAPDASQARTELQSWLHASNLVVSWQRSFACDPFGLRALASGIACVCAANSAMQELIRPGVNGDVVLAARKHDEWAQRISELLASERVQRSRAFVSMGSHLPTLEECVSAWENHLKSVLRAGIQRRLNKPVDVEARDDMVVRQGWLLHYTDGARTERMLERAGIRLPERAQRSDTDDLVTQHSDGHSTRIPLTGARTTLDAHFTPESTRVVELRFWRHDADAGPRAMDAARLLQAAGVTTPAVFVAGSNGRRSFLVTASPPGAMLIEFVRAYGEARQERGRLVLRAMSNELAKALAQLHKAGLLHSELFATSLSAALGLRHDIVINLLSVQNLKQVRGQCTLKDIASELGALHLSLPSELISRTVRLRFLRQYLSALGQPMALSALVAGIVREARQHQQRHQKVIASPQAAGNSVDAAQRMRKLYAHATMNDIESQL